MKGNNFRLLVDQPEALDSANRQILHKKFKECNGLSNSLNNISILLTSRVLQNLLSF